VVTETSSSELLQRYVNSMHEKQKLFIGDIFVFKLITFPLKQNIFSEPKVGKHGQFVVAGTEKDTSELIELLQKCAVEKFTTCRQLQARQFVSLATIVTTDYEALYAYKRSDYQRCLQLSIQNVHTLLYAGLIYSDVAIHKVFIQLLDDDIVSLTTLMLIVNAECRQNSSHSVITQMTLSLYLMTQCLLKLRHSVMSLAQTLHYITLAQRKTAAHRTLDQLTLRLAWRKIATIRYDTIGEFNVDSKAEYSALSSTRSQKKKLKQTTPAPL